MAARCGPSTTLKDIVWVEGWGVRYGSAATPAEPCGADALVLALRRQAGAVFVAQTTTPEFGWMAVTDGALRGITRNPWNPWNRERTPGGPSGGAAGAAAMGAGSTRRRTAMRRPRRPLAHKAALAASLVLAVLAVLAGPGAGAGMAAGKLNIYNWGNYTSSELIRKFEAEFAVKVTDSDSNDVAFAKVKAGGHGFDIVVPSASYVPVWISEGLLTETRPDQMPNDKNMDDRWVDVPFDPGHRSSVPWQWGTTAITLNKSVYAGAPNTSAILLDPPEKLKARSTSCPR